MSFARSRSFHLFFIFILYLSSGKAHDATFWRSRFDNAEILIPNFVHFGYGSGNHGESVWRIQQTHIAAVAQAVKTANNRKNSKLSAAARTRVNFGWKSGEVNAQRKQHKFMYEKHYPKFVYALHIRALQICI